MIETKKGRLDLFRQGFEAFCPDKEMEARDDAASYILWQQCYAGLRLAWADLLETHEYLIHQGAGWASSSGIFSLDERYIQAVQSLTITADKAIEPCLPPSCYWPSTKPVPPTEDDAWHIFYVAYKNKWPSNRINSKHAKAKWRETKDKAMIIAKEEYEEMYARWEEEETRKRKIEEDKQAKYQKELAMFQALKNAVQKIEEDNK